MSSKIGILMTPRERELVLEFGYPFEGIERQLKEHAESRADVEIVDDPYWWEQVLGQLSISVNEKAAEAAVLLEIDELAEAVEIHLRPRKFVVLGEQETQAGPR